MERYALKNDVKLFCVTARTFPDGIMEAFQVLEGLHPSISGRPFYGISYPNPEGGIIYNAAVPEAFEGEGEKYGCMTVVIVKGDYLTETILDFMKNTEAIPKAFQRLLAAPELDRNFPCVEWYKSAKEVMCMVKADPLKHLFNRIDLLMDKMPDKDLETSLTSLKGILEHYH